MQNWLLIKSVCAWGKRCFFKKYLRTSSYVISSMLLVVHEFSSKCCLWNYKAVMPTDSAELHFFSLTLYLWPGKRPSHRQGIYFFQYKVYQVYYMWIYFSSFMSTEEEMSVLKYQFYKNFSKTLPRYRNLEIHF